MVINILLASTYPMAPQNGPESLELSQMSGDSGYSECDPVSLRNTRRIIDMDICQEGSADAYYGDYVFLGNAELLG